MTWHQTPGDATSVTVPVSNWQLTMYTPARFGDSFERFLDFRNRPWGTEKTNEELLAVIPGFRPKRFRVMLPTVVIDGREHPLAPIEFEYKPGGVGLAVWP